MGGLVWGLVWVGLGWRCVCSRSTIAFLNSPIGTRVWEGDLAAVWGVGLGLVLLGLWLVLHGFLSKTNISKFVHRNGASTSSSNALHNLRLYSKYAHSHKKYAGS